MWGGCGDNDPGLMTTGAGGIGGGAGGTTAFCEALSSAGGSAGSTGHALIGPPLSFSPTAQGFGLNVAVKTGDPATIGVRIRAEAAANWGAFALPRVRGSDVAEWTLRDLQAGTRYRYEVVDCRAGADATLYEGSVVTARPPGDRFSFTLISDTHIGADLSFTNQGNPATLSGASAQMAAASPDFLLNLGDILDFHQYGFNVPPPDGSITRLAYLNYRTTLGGLLGNTAHYPVLGGWDSENGCDTLEEIERSRQQRLLYLPAAGPETYPQGGSAFQDYYAFNWGDALFVVLNVYTYTPGCHLLGAFPGLPDDWTLGAAQLDWLRATLAKDTSKWKFLFIHHPVGGSAGDDINSAYGRGGGLAAHVGEQEIVHQLMIQHRVQVMFYGHDHVFTDMVVDDIHYTLPGSAGAIWMFSAAETGYTQFWPDAGWGRVDVSPDDVRVRFMALDGEVLHEYTIE
jgi:hypothetical protein